jgi:hypothetical protein
MAAQPFHQARPLVKQNGLTQQVALIEGQALDRLNPEDRRQAVDDVIRPAGGSYGK